jgi:membrane-associated phospholipid phosphatase
MLGYLSAVAVVALSRLEARPGASWVIGANLLIAGLVVLLHQDGLGRFGRTLRDIYPLVLLPALYGSLDILNGPGMRTWDPQVQAWEAALFGGQVSRTWWQSAPDPYWSTALHATYFSYYFIVPFPALLFLIRRDKQRMHQAITLVMVTFLVCYLWFLLFPVAGPYYEFPRPSAAFLDNWAARLVYDTLARGSSYGAAFPSSHVAATVAAAIGTWLGARVIGTALFVPTLLMAVGVVYCQMHYAVDAVAGLIVPVLVAAILRHRASPSSSSPP